MEKILVPLAGTIDIRLWLDDERNPPTGWVWVKTAKEAMRVITSGKVLVVSLDHDLGLPLENGGDVLRWLEEQVFVNGFWPPLIEIHTMNPVARSWMLKVARKINARTSGEL